MRRAAAKAKAPRKSPPASPAMPPGEHLVRMDRYVRQLASGEIYAAESTRQAAQRHLRDLARQSDPSWPYRFDGPQAARAFRFCHLFPHVKGDLSGQPHVLHEWALFFLGSIFGWRLKEGGGRRFRVAEAWIPRGNDKSTTLAKGSLYAAFAEGGQADVFSLATTKEQAGHCWEAAAMMVRARENVRDALGIEVFKTAIVQQRTNSSFRRLASRDTTLDGLNVSWATLDELHQIPRPLWEVILTALGKRQNSILVSISTAGMDSESFGHEQYRYCKQILAGEVKDETTLALIYEYPSEGDVYSEKAQRAANPMFGLSVRPEILRAAAEKAKRSHRERAAYLVKHMNVWQNARAPYFDGAAWNACADPNLKIEDFTRDPCFIGLDLASRNNFACVCRLFCRDLPHHEPERAAEGETERHYYSFVDSYLNEEAIAASPTDAFKAWAAEGLLVSTPGNVTDYGFIEARIIADVTRFDVREVASDPYEAAQLSQRLGPAVPFVEYPQRTVNLSPPLKEMAGLVLQGRWHHDGNPVMTWMIGNVTAREDANENVHPRKEAEASFIDGVSATLNALGRAMVSDGSNSASYLETEDLVLL